MLKNQVLKRVKFIDENGRKIYGVRFAQYWTGEKYRNFFPMDLQFISKLHSLYRLTFKHCTQLSACFLIINTVTDKAFKDNHLTGFLWSSVKNDNYKPVYPGYC